MEQVISQGGSDFSDWIIKSGVDKLFKNVGGRWTATHKQWIDDGTASGYYKHSHGTGDTPHDAIIQLIKVRTNGL